MGLVLLALLAVGVAMMTAEVSADLSAVLPPSGIFPVPFSHLRWRTLFCQERTCKEPATLPITLFEVVETVSPLYISVLPLNNETELIDNVCYTFFETGIAGFLVYISAVFKDGSSRQWSSLEDDIPGHPGTLAGGNPTCMYREYLIKPACQATFILYRCFHFGSCNQFDAGYTPGVETLYAISAEPKHSDTCQEEQVALLKGAGYNDRGFVKLPQTLPYQCVTSLKGAPCVNAEKVPEGNSIPKP